MNTKACRVVKRPFYANASTSISGNPAGYKIYFILSILEQESLRSATFWLKQTHLGTYL